MTYNVNGQEFSTKKDATAAVFDAVEAGEEVTVSKVAGDEEGAEAQDNSSASPVEGTEIIL